MTFLNDRYAGLDPESAAALAALASCWARKLPRVFRYGALKRHGALRFLEGYVRAAPAPAPDPRTATLRGGLTIDDLRARRSSADTLAALLLRECTNIEQPFPLTRVIHRGDPNGDPCLN